jgi:hypothetical protein
MSPKGTTRISRTTGREWRDHLKKLSILGPTVSKVDNEKSFKKLILFLLDRQNV